MWRLLIESFLFGDSMGMKMFEKDMALSSFIELRTSIIKFIFNILKVIIFWPKKHWSV